MGYRNYFYLVPKKIVKDIQKLNTKEELAQYVATSNHFHESNRKEAQNAIDKNDFEDYYIGIYDFGEKLHEFGKLYFDNETYEAITKNGIDLFKKETELAEIMEDFDAKIVGKDAVIAVADCYLKRVIKYYENLLKTPEELKKEAKEQNKSIFLVEQSSVEEKLKQDIREKLFWLKQYALDFNENNKYSITDSCLYEYNMFELVHQLKMINFKKYDIIECGW